MYDLVVRQVKRWLSEAAAAVDPVDAAHALVALNRGLIATQLAGLLGSSPRNRDRRWRVAIDAQMGGLAVAEDRSKRR